MGIKLELNLSRKFEKLEEKLKKNEWKKNEGRCLLQINSILYQKSYTHASYFCCCEFWVYFKIWASFFNALDVYLDV